MVRAQCPGSISKFGFCGLLATLYAAKQPIPSSAKKFDAYLLEVKRILSLGRGKWGKDTQKSKGAISLPQTLELLAHYNTCAFEVARFTDGAPTLRQWLRTAPARAAYIVHTKRHAMFVEIGAVKAKWRLYDQGGAHTKQSGFLEKKGGYGRKTLVAVITITYPCE
jgi:hypothetical protein